MRFVWTSEFKADYQNLSEYERSLFKIAAREFSTACEEFVMSGKRAAWPPDLCIRNFAHTPGVLEMTWSSGHPDGRATWEPITTVDESGQEVPGVRWRRLGTNRILSGPQIMEGETGISE